MNHVMYCIILVVVAVVCGIPMKRYHRHPNGKAAHAHPLSSLHLHHGSGIWGELRFQDPCTYFTVGKVKASTLSLTVLATWLKCFGPTALHNGPSSHQRAYCNITDLSESKPAFPRSIFHYAAFIDFLGMPSLDSDSARSWMRDFSKFHPESSINSASSQPASGGHRDVKCLQRGVGGWLVVANGPVGKSMASRRMYGPLSLYEHHEREHHALAWPSCPMMLRIQWCSCLKVLSSSTLLLSLFWWSWISLFSLVFAMDFATLAGHWRDICVPLFCLWHSGDSLHAIPGQSLCRLPAWLAWLGALKKG